MAVTQLRIALAFLSDWHVGAGGGRHGHVDRLVRRDPRDGLPYVPAKTLTGMLRDACESAARALDRGTDSHRWEELLVELFGDEPAKRAPGVGRPIPGLLSIRPARFRPELREWLLHDARLAAALTFVKPGIAIDPDTGQSRSDFLRMEEMVRGGTTLAAEGEVDFESLPHDCRQPARALLWAGSRLVERIGGKRRRGAGHCQLELEEGRADRQSLDDSTDDFLQVLGDAASWTATRLEREESVLGGSSARPTQWVRIPLEIQLEDPVVVPHRVSGNAVECLDFIPGTMLLGPVLERMSRALGRPAFPFVASGALRVLNAYVRVDGDRGRPVPFAIEHDKHDRGLEDGSPAWNSLRETVQTESTKQHRAGYVGSLRDGCQPRLRQPRRVHTTHNTINDTQQRPIEAEVGVYSYQALAAGTIVRSELRVSSLLASELPADWTNCFDGSIRLGIAKKDDYARADMRAGNAEPCSPVTAHGGVITLWMLSDALLRGRALEPEPTLRGLRHQLEAALNVNLKEPSGDRCRLRTRRTEGWQSRWGLPRPSMIGIEAGSVAEFVVDGEPPLDLADRLTALADRGIGERCGEGYGEVAINDELLMAPLHGLGAAKPPSPQAAAPQPKLLDLTDDVGMLEREAWRTQIRRRVAGWAHDGGRRRRLLKWRGNDDRQPGNSQLGRLRSFLMAFDSEAEVPGIIAWLDASVERGKWPEDAASALKSIFEPGSGAALAGLADVLGAPPGSSLTEIWKDFPVATANAVSRLSDELWPEIWRSALLAAIHAEQRQREDEGRRS